MSEIQDAVTLAAEWQLRTAISNTEAELEYVHKLMELRGPTEALVTDELEVLARLADLKIQAGVV